MIFLASSSRPFERLFLSSRFFLGVECICFFLDLPSILFILLGVAGFVLLFGRKEFGRGVKTFFAFSYPPNEDNIEVGQFFLRLANFIPSWGVLGMVAGMVLVMGDLNPDTVGPAVAIALFCPFYAIGLALFVFLPIGLRLSPQALQLSGFWRFSTRQLFVCLGFLFLLGYLVIFFSDLGVFPPRFNLGSILLFVDMPSVILMLGSWWIFRMASGQRRRWIGAPAVILMGFFWTIMGIVLMLSNLNPDTLGPGLAVSLITAFYSLIVAIGFLIADIRSESGNSGVPSSPVPLDENTEQAKEIIDNVVAKERR